MPRPLAAALSPAAVRVENAFALVPAAGSRPLTINLPDSAAAVALLGGVLLLFLTARQMFDRGGVRTIVRIIAVTALALSAIALAQDATAKGLMYWRFAPGREGPDPFGPFVNRNHFATWAMMAAPLCAGYLAAHAAAHPQVRTAGWRRKDAQGTGRADLDACGGGDAPGHRHSGLAVTVGARRDDNGSTLCRDPGAPAYGGRRETVRAGPRRL